MTSLLLLIASQAFATELTINATDGQTAIVLVDDFVKGETPVVTDVDGGDVTLSFRSSMFGPVLFSKTVSIPASGSVAFDVDLSARSVTEAGSGTATPAPAPKPEPEPEPAAPEATRLRIGGSGAAITLDGKSTGKTTPATLDVDPGRHELTLTKGCESGTASISATEGKTADIDVPMKSAKFLLSIKTNPVGAQILVDGNELGNSPLEAKLSCGTREVKAMADGHLAATATVNLEGADDVTLTLEPELFGAVEINVEPSNTQIKLDGEKVGTGSVTLDEVRVGPHKLTLERKGEILEERTINVKENGEMVLSLVVSTDGGKKPKPDKNTDKPDPDKTAKVDEPKPEKQPKDRPARKSAGRLVANTLVTAAAIPFVPLGLYNYTQARTAYDDYQNMPEGDERDAFYKEQVAPRQTVAFAEWGAGGALLLTGTTMWITSLVDAPVLIAPTRNGVMMSGRW